MLKRKLFEASASFLQRPVSLQHFGPETDLIKLNVLANSSKNERSVLVDFRHKEICKLLEGWKMY